MSSTHRVVPSKAVVASALDFILSDIHLQMEAEGIGSGDYMTRQKLLLDADIEAVSIALEAFKENALDRMAELRYGKSRLLHLPDELLSFIFLCVIEIEIPLELIALDSLSVVCTRFHHITKSTPMLWGYLRSNRGLRQLKLQLKNSRNGPLSIQWNHDSLEEPQYSMFLTQLRRWKTANITCLPHKNSIQLAQDAAPLLETFVMHTFNKDLDFQVNLFLGHAPRLRHLDAPGVPIPWSSPILSGLTFLSILAFDGSTVPSAAEFCSVLQSCPELEELYITGREEDCLSDNPTAFLSNIHLSKLRELGLIKLQPLLVNSILSSLKGLIVPHIYVMLPSILVDNAGESLAQAFSDLPSDSVLSEILHFPKVVSLNDLENDSDVGPSLSVGLEAAQNRFKCEFEGIKSSFVIFDIMFPETKRTGIQSLSLNAVGELLDQDPHPRIFSGMTGLRGLSLTSYSDRCPLDAMIPFQRESSLSESIVWPCPKLESLNVHLFGFPIDLDKLLVLLESRNPKQVSRVDLAEGPVQLNRLCIENYSTHRMQTTPIEKLAKIADIVGRNDFTLDKHRFNDSNEWVSVWRVGNRGEQGF